MEQGLGNPYVGSELSDKWMTFFTDVVHPSDEGYREYADTVIAFLEEEMQGDPAQAVRVKRSLPAPLTSAADDELQYIVVQESMAASAKNWRYSSALYGENNSTPYNGYLFTVTADNEFQYTFTGNAISLYGAYTGTFECAIDGGEWQAYTANTNNPKRVAQDLPDGSHTLRLRAPGASGRTPFQLCALLVE